MKIQQNNLPTTSLQYEADQTKFDRDAYFAKNGIGEISKSGNGQIQIKVSKYDYLFLQPEREIKIERKYLKQHFENRTRFTVYMGYGTTDIEFEIQWAREHGINVHHLDSVEEWEYSFIAIENRAFTFPKGHQWEEETIRWSPFESLRLAEEMEIVENDFRHHKFYLSNFLVSARKITGRELPMIIQTQLHTMEQVYSGNAVEVIQ